MMLHLLLLLLLMGPSRHWQYKQNNKIQSHLTDHLIGYLGVSSEGSVAKRLTADEHDALACAINRTAAKNGLQLDTHTATDGDCGPDSILRNLERHGHGTRACTQVLDTLRLKGRKPALNLLRKLLVQWVKSHSSTSVLPDLTLRALCCMDSHYTSFDKYLEAMGKPCVWIDTPMLYAASAVFEMQIIVFVGSGEPQLVAAAPIAGRTCDTPIAVIANVNNIHFLPSFRPPRRHQRRWCSLAAPTTCCCSACRAQVVSNTNRPPCA